jgi:hypothetical protein
MPCRHRYPWSSLSSRAPVANPLAPSSTPIHSHPPAIISPSHHHVYSLHTIVVPTRLLFNPPNYSPSSVPARLLNRCLPSPVRPRPPTAHPIHWRAITIKNACPPAAPDHPQPLTLCSLCLHLPTWNLPLPPHPGPLSHPILTTPGTRMLPPSDVVPSCKLYRARCDCAATNCRCVSRVPWGALSLHTAPTAPTAPVPPARADMGCTWKPLRRASRRVLVQSSARIARLHGYTVTRLATHTVGYKAIRLHNHTATLPREIRVYQRLPASASVCQPHRSSPLHHFP